MAMRPHRFLLMKRDPLNGGSSMTLGSKGMKLSSGPQRRRTPWTAAKEYIPGVVLNTKEKTILEGHQPLENEAIDRASQPDPLDVLKSAVALYEYNTSTGKNIFQIASQTKCDGRGQRFYRKEWQEGTYEKYVTLSGIDFSRDENKGTAYGYITFHGESTTQPVEIDYADTPGWVMDYEEKMATPANQIVSPPPSVGTDIPVDWKTYRLRAYPYFDAPNPAEFVERLLKDRGVIPDVPTSSASDGDASESGADSSEHHGK